MMATSYALSAWFFTRMIALIYCVAFVSVAVQAKGLWGSRGVLPISSYLEAVEMQTGASRFWQLPSLFWFGSDDSYIAGAAWLGAACALLAFCGIAQGWMFLFCFALYLSFVTAGQDFMSFQWDALLLEVGFLTLFVAPWTFGFDLFTAHEPHWSVRALFYLVLFKLMFLSGVVKLLSGDVAWRDLTAMNFHYWTQPLPNPISPFMHALPEWFHKAETAMTFVVELALPFLILFPRTRVLAAIGFAGLSLLIFATGNYTFFNLLTIILCIWLIPDHWFEPLTDALPFRLGETPATMFAHPALIGATTVLALFSVYWCTRFWISERVNAALWPAVKIVQALHISNPYGLFATMTKSRPEIIFEGSNDGNEWKEYDLIYKPGNLYHSPPVVAPHQPRLDWQLWFAALGRFRDNFWVQNLMVRMFENSPDVMPFFSLNPFEEKPPKFLRARLYNYTFTTPAEITGEGKWWKRELLGEYSPVLKRP